MVKLPLKCNVILGRHVLYDFEAVTSIKYLAMKFPTNHGVQIVIGRQEEARAIYLATIADLKEDEVDLKVMEVRMKLRK